MFVGAGFSFDEVSNMTLSQIKSLTPAISDKSRMDGLNNMSWNRVAYHADSEDFAKITKDLQRK